MVLDVRNCHQRSSVHVRGCHRVWWPIARWEPDSHGRLARAAIELFGERGFEQTTVADIARRAGLTERTFFRYFADKREVLFDGAGQLQEQLVAAVAAAPPVTAPLDAVVAALEVAGRGFDERRAFAGVRQAVIVANPELRERELIKLAALATALAGVLRERGVGDPAAGLAAEAGMAVFRVAFERWVDDGDERDFGSHLRTALAQLRVVTAVA